MGRQRFIVRGIAAVAIGCAALVPDLASDPSSSGGPALALGSPRFVEETSSAGIDHLYTGGFDYAAGGGVAAFDCSGDRKADLYLAGGAGPAALYRNDSPLGGTLRLTRLPDPPTDLANRTRAYPLDIDGDGITDLVLLPDREKV